MGSKPNLGSSIVPPATILILVLALRVVVPILFWKGDNFFIRSRDPLPVERKSPIFLKYRSRRSQGLAEKSRGTYIPRLRFTVRPFCRRLYSPALKAVPACSEGDPDV